MTANTTNAPKILLAVLAMTAVAFSGCVNPSYAVNDCWQDVDSTAHEPSALHIANHDFDANEVTAYADLGFDGSNWPDLTGHELTIIDHGAFDWAFEAAKPIFEELTGATVIHIAADDAGSALQQAIDDRRAGGGSFDVLYGVDNVLMTKATEADLFDPYTPLLGSRVDPTHRFIPADDGVWEATPVDFGFIAVNGDPRHDVTLDGLADLVDQADTFVTMDPRFSSPGLGFLLATVATYGEDCYLGYWDALLDGGATVTQGWTEGYVNRFSGGYGQWEGQADKHLVTSYTTSPAYETYYGYETLNDVLLAPQATFKQIQTMGILHGADRVAAEAWIEFTLTDDFQNLAAAYNAIYPVVDNDATQAATQAVYAGNDPAPGSFVAAQLDSQRIGDNVDDWVQAWVDLYEAKAAA